MQNNQVQSASELSVVSSTATNATAVLDELIADEDFCDTVRYVIRKAWAEEFNNYDSDCPQGYLPVRGYHEAAKGLTKALRSLGWERDQPLGAERWTHWTRYSRPVQLAIANVHRSGDNFKGASKGRAAEIFDGQGRLFEDEPLVGVEGSIGGVYPVWGLICFTNDTQPNIQILLARATVEGIATARYDILDKRELYYGPLTPAVDLSEQPEAVPIRFDVEEIEEVVS